LSSVLCGCFARLVELLLFTWIVFYDPSAAKNSPSFPSDGVFFYSWPNDTSAGPFGADFSFFFLRHSAMNYRANTFFFTRSFSLSSRADLANRAFLLLRFLCLPLPRSRAARHPLPRREGQKDPLLKPVAFIPSLVRKRYRVLLFFGALRKSSPASGTRIPPLRQSMPPMSFASPSIFSPPSHSAA